MRFFLYPYRVGSRSASALATALGGRVLKREGSTFVLNNNRKVINWGSSETPGRVGTPLNPSSAVRVAGNKLSFFRKAAETDPASGGPRMPRWTESRTEALEWLSLNPRQGGVSKVVARTSLTGHSGAGIVVVDKDHPEALPEAPLYVEYVPKDGEYRVHLFRTNPGVGYDIIDTQRKIRDPSREPTNWHVRSHNNGFIFVREGFTVPPDVLEQARRAIIVSGLDFGAVDVIFNQKRNQAFTLEINTACGMEGTTVTKYANAIRRYYGQS